MSFSPPRIAVTKLQRSTRRANLTSYRRIVNEAIPNRLFYQFIQSLSTRWFESSTKSSPVASHDEFPTPRCDTPQTRAPARRARSSIHPEARRRSTHTHAVTVRSTTSHSQGSGEQAARGRQIRGTGVSGRRPRLVIGQGPRSTVSEMLI